MIQTRAFYKAAAVFICHALPVYFPQTGNLQRPIRSLGWAGLSKRCANSIRVDINALSAGFGLREGTFDSVFRKKGRGWI